jgi:predicted nucleic acid-binding protein
MAKYLFDTNTISTLFDISGKENENNDHLCSKLQSLKNHDEIYISILTLYELEYGYEKAPNSIKPKIRFIINQIKLRFPILPLSQEGSQFWFTKKRSNHRKKSFKKQASKHNIDIILASTALVESCILVSDDSIYSEYLQKIDQNLNTENWTKLNP